MRQAARDYAAMPEKLLLRHAQGGDRDAFRAIMQRHNQRLFRVARAVVSNDDEAEDVLQDAYLKAFTAIGLFRGEAGLNTWLTAITLNEARGRLRRRRPAESLERMEEDGVRVIPFPGMAEIPDPEAEAVRSETRRLLERAIDGLPDEFRLVFMLRDVEGLSVEETATQLDLNPQTVRSRLFRARQSLRQSLMSTLSSGMEGVFPFLGARCSRIADRVLERLSVPAPPD
ncbi:MAG: RNA polymerase sigma factor [Alphaproteobacteria bacterium]|nr:RNA polymerase sigma factor [Alphaproteobacteria bacterium]